MERSINDILVRGKRADRVIIVGAGNRGRELLSHLKNNNSINVEAFFDNNEDIIGNAIDDVKILKPCKIGESCLYIIAVDAEKYRKDFYIQLQELGINKKDIITYYYYRDYDYLRNLDEKYYQDEIEAMYYEKFGERMNWQNPVS